MKNCLIVINTAAGGSKRISFDKVESCLGDGYNFCRFTLPDDGEPCLDGFDCVAVCGGDGTLSTVLEKAYALPIDIFYFPVGTLNDRAKAERYSHAKSACPSASKTSGECSDCSCSHFSSQSKTSRAVVGKASANGQTHIFTYVLAAGSFTPIGYAVSPAVKKKLGVLAYVLQVLRQYRIHRIKAVLQADGRTFEGEYTLVMLLKSPRCFGFKFNRDFDPKSCSGHLLAVKAPKVGGILGLVSMFFPFFRIFFMGLKEERTGKILFVRANKVKIVQNSPVTYCRDGEKQPVNAGEIDVEFVRTAGNFTVIEKF